MGRRHPATDLSIMERGVARLARLAAPRPPRPSRPRAKPFHALLLAPRRAALSFGPVRRVLPLNTRRAVVGRATGRRKTIGRRSPPAASRRASQTRRSDVQLAPTATIWSPRRSAPLSDTGLSCRSANVVGPRRPSDWPAVRRRSCSSKMSSAGGVLPSWASAAAAAAAGATRRSAASWLGDVQTRSTRSSRAGAHSRGRFADVARNTGEKKFTTTMDESVSRAPRECARTALAALVSTTRAPGSRSPAAAGRAARRKACVQRSRRPRCARRGRRRRVGRGGRGGGRGGGGGGGRRRQRATRASRSRPSPGRAAAPRPRATGAQLSDEQRAAQRAPRRRVGVARSDVGHFHGRLSDFNRGDAPRRGAGERRGDRLPGLGDVFEGRPIHISDDLVALREEARSFARWDVGGWRLNHPIGKLIAFQQGCADVDGGPPPPAVRRRAGVAARRRGGRGGDGRGGAPRLVPRRRWSPSTPSAPRSSTTSSSRTRRALPSCAVAALRRRAAAAAVLSGFGTSCGRGRCASSGTTAAGGRWR